MPVQDIVLSAPTLQRIRSLSRPIAILLSVALGLIVVAAVIEIGALLFAFHRGDAWQALASYSGAGFNLSVSRAADHAQQAGAAAVESLDLTQRLQIAGLAAVCAGCSAMAIFNLRQLFALYAKGEVFARENASRLKQFALWLVLAALAINISGRAFVALTGAAPATPANVVMTVFFGAMIYVVAHVMDLACEADQERQEFI